jgi:amino acid permease
MSSEEVKIEQKPEKKLPLRNTSLTKAVFNLSKSAIGLGAIFLPGNLQRMGLIGGIFMITVGAITSAISLHLLGEMSHYYLIGDFFELGMAAFGDNMAVFVSVVLVLFQVGGLIAYCKFAGSYLSSALGLFLKASGSIPWWRSYRFLSIIIGSFFMFPLSLLKDMSKLGYISIAGMLCIFYITVLTVIDYFVEGKVPNTDYTMIRVGSDFLNAFSSIMFAFVNQFTLLALIPVLINPRNLRRSSLISSSSSIVTLVYLLIGICGYLHFGNNVASDILSAPESPSMFYAVARMLVSVVLICSYPLLLDPPRTAADHLTAKIFARTRFHQAFQAAKWRRHITWTFIIVFIPLLFAITAADYVEPVLEIFSSACGALLVFVLPSAYFIKLGRKEKVMPSRLPERILAYFNFIFGVIICIGGTIGAIIDVVRKIKS